MGSPKPTLGFRSRTEAVIQLRRDGLTTRQISDKLCIEEKTVTALEHSAGRAKKLRPTRPAEESGRAILFPTVILDRLAPHAAKRGIHPNSLARRIVETVADEGLIDSVLDDEEAWLA